MTAALAYPSPFDVVHAALADAAVRQRIEAIVRRRVAPQDVGDVMQAIACDALASDQVPTDPGDVPRWLFGIARHKVADLHRRAGRQQRRDAGDPELVACAAAPLEARSLLRSVLADAARQPRGVETMRWIAREADGERLDEMARQANLQPATVRQRVSRMRRWLKKRWLREALLLSAATLVAAVVLASASGPRIAPVIVADPQGDPAAAASAALQGSWRVAGVEPDASLDPARRALVDADALTTVVAIEGDRVRFRSATRHGERRIECGPVRDGRFEVRVIDAAGNVQRATAGFDGEGRLVVVGTGGDWPGRAVLVR